MIYPLSLQRLFMQKLKQDSELLYFSTKQAIRCLSFLKNNDDQILIVTDSAISVYDFLQANVLFETSLNPKIQPIWCKNITAIDDSNQYFFVQGKMGSIELYQLICRSDCDLDKQKMEQNIKQLVLLEQVRICQSGFTKIRFHQDSFNNQGILLHHENSKIQSFFTVNEQEHQIIDWRIQALEDKPLKKRLYRHKKYGYNDQIQINLNAIRSFEFNNVNYVILGLEGFEIQLFELNDLGDEYQPIKYRIPSKNKQNLIVYSIEMMSQFLFLVTLRNQSSVILEWSKSNNTVNLLTRIQNSAHYRYTLPIAIQQIIIISSNYSIENLRFNRAKLKQKSKRGMQGQHIQQKQEQNLKKSDLLLVQKRYQIVPKTLLKSSALNFSIVDFCVKTRNQNNQIKSKIIGCSQNKKIFFLQINLL